MNKKLVSVFLTASTLIWGLGIATLPLASAQTTASLQAQIASLLAQIQQLQAQLSASTGAASVSASYNFTRDLTVGSTGADVKALQEFLNANGAQVAASGAGSPGSESNYFGGLTKAALAKYQAAHGIKPAAGYFGPITRSYIASLSVGTSTGTGTGTGTGTSTSTVPATGLSVSLSSSNPAAGSLISSADSAAARVPVLAINLTASNSGAVTVTDLKVHKTGVLSDSSMSGAYLVQNGQVLYQYTSLNSGVIDFSNMNLSVPAGQTVTLQVAIDPSTGLSAGNTVGFAVTSASDVSAVDSSNNSVTPSGSFPLSGNIFTVTTVTNPSLATLKITSSSIATQVTAGSQGNIVGAWSFDGSNSLTYLKGIKFTVIGSANNADLKNVKLLVNGSQVGPTLSSVSSDGTAYFDLSSSSASLNTGNNNVQVEADVMGSPSKNFQFEILNSYDVYAVDSQYNVPIAVTLGSGVNDVSVYQVTIQQGQITVTQDSNTPTGNIAVGQSSVTLAKFDVYAAGEPVKVKFLDFEIDLTGQGAGALSTQLKNVSLVDDAGGQVGTTINTPPSSNTCTANGVAAYATSTGIYKDCFGTSASPINYIVPANTTRVLSLQADIQSTADFSSIVANLTSEANNDNLQGLTSSQSASSGSANGSSLSLQSSLLTVAKNSAYGDQTIQPGTSNVKIGSYAFSASSASGVQINTVSIEAAKSGSGSGDLNNLKVMIGGTQFGTTQPTVADAGKYTFTGPAFTVPAGGTTYVDVYADVLSSATSTSPATSLTGCSGTSVVSYSAVSCSGAIDGQNVTVSTSGADVTIGLDSSAPAASQLVMGSTGNTVAAFRFTETSNVANVKMTDLTITQNTTSSAQSAYSNLTLYNGSTAVGTAGSASSTSAGFVYKFHFASAPVISQNGTLVLTLKGDVASYSSGGASDNTTSTFAIATTTDVTALTVGSNKAAVLTGTPTGNTMTVLRTTLTPGATAQGTLTGRVKTSVDNLASIALTANNAGSAELHTLAITFSGSAIGASTTASDFSLIDTNNVNVTNASSYNATTSGTCASSPCTITWTFPTSTPLVVSAGGSYSLTLRADDTGFVVVSGSNSVGLSATIQSSGDMTYYDNSTATGSTVSLPTTLVPLPITTVSFASGS
jgi:Putative peptidoglycan binding domain